MVAIRETLSSTLKVPEKNSSNKELICYSYNCTIFSEKIMEAFIDSRWAVQNIMHYFVQQDFSIEEIAW